jgi:hypothetical protein
MKKVMLSALACCLALSAAAAKNPSKPDVKESTVTGWVTDPMCANTPNQSNAECTKKCAAKDGKLVLVTDGDSKVWAVINPAALKGQEGRHVKVSGRPDEDKGTIEVSTVAVLDNQPTPAKKMEKKSEKKSEKKT